METERIELKKGEKVYFLILAGGMGARVIQTAFIRSLLRKRKEDGNNHKILVVDNTLIGMMVSEALKDQGVFGLQVPEYPQSWPQDPGLMTIENNSLEHPMFVESWRNNFKQYDTGYSLHDLLMNNISRAYSIEYGFQLIKKAHQHKFKSGKDSFIGHHYGSTMDLEYDNGLPMLKFTLKNADLDKFMNNSRKPVVLMHLGVDRNPQEFMSPINYRLHKVWSLNRWAEVVQKLKDKYTFVQVYASQYNPEIPDVHSIKVENLNPVLQILQHPKCKFFMSIDNYLAHLAATIKKRGIVLWGSVSPHVWGWTHNINIWNKHSCPDIACWRPGQFDQDQNGKMWVCDHYSCMRSISTDQVIRNISKLEKLLENDKTKKEIVL